MAFKDKAQTTDVIVAGLSTSSAGACKGPGPEVCTLSDRLRPQWCAYCKAKTPVQ